MKLLETKKFLAVVLSGIILTLSFPTPSWFALAWIGLVPLLVVLEELSYREVFLAGWLMGLVHFTTLLYWIYHVVNHYGKVPMPLGVITLLLLTSYLALFPAVSCFIYRLLVDRWGFPVSVASSVAWVSMEYVRGHFMTGFPWGLIGYSQIPWKIMVQSMDLFGVAGISFLVVYSNGVFYSLVKRPFSRTTIAEAVIFVLMMGCNYWYGVHRIHGIDGLLSRADSMKVAVVQGNVPQDVKWDKRFQKETLSKYETLTEKAIKVSNPALVIWPETAVPFSFGIDRDLSVRVLNIAKKNRVYLLFGAPGLEYHNSKPCFYNWALLASPRGRISGVYAKEHLVPFGEYVPLKEMLFFVQKLAEGVGDFVAGPKKQELFDIDGKKIGTLICYEVIFPELALGRLEQGSDMLVNISNDAWFGNTSAPYQHLEMARARSIETRLPLVRCTNTGISAFINPKGEITGMLPLNTTGYLVEDVKMPTIKSTYVGVRDFLSWLCMFCSIVVMLYSLYGKITNRG